MPTPKEPELSLTLLPAGLRVLIAGGGKVAAQKLKALPKGLKVLLVAPKIGASLKRSGLSLKRRAVRLTDLEHADIIFAATDDAGVNAALAKRGRALGKLVSVADDPRLGNFSLPAVAKVGPLKISISSSGASPAVVKALRQWLEARLRGSRLLQLTQELGKRRAWLKTHPEEKEKLLRSVRDPRAFSKMLK
jgi:siroheme synthase-like protein